MGILPQVTPITPTSTLTLRSLLQGLLWNAALLLRLLPARVVALKAALMQWGRPCRGPAMAGSGQMDGQMEGQMLPG